MMKSSSTSFMVSESIGRGQGGLRLEDVAVLRHECGRIRLTKGYVFWSRPNADEALPGHPTPPFKFRNLSSILTGLIMNIKREPVNGTHVLDRGIENLPLPLLR